MSAGIQRSDISEPLKFGIRRHMTAVSRHRSTSAPPARQKPTAMSELGTLGQTKQTQGWWRTNLTRITFIGFVVVPTIIAAIFYGFIATPRYASETRFIVRSLSSTKVGGFDMLFRTIGIAKTADDAYVIQRFLLSRDALTGLAEKGVDLKKIFGRPSADRMSRYPYFWRQDSIESLYDYYLDHVQVVEDSVKGILTLRTITFSADDSQLLATALLKLAEEMVNRMNERAQADAISTAVDEVKKAEANVVATQTAITAFRNREITLDPSKTSVGVLDTITSLSTDLAYITANLQEMRANSPNNPAIPSTVAKIASIEDRIRTERAKLAGGRDTLSDKISVYDQLSLRRTIADKGLASSLVSLETAREEARRQHIYIESLVSANRPDESTEPERLRAVATVLILGFAVFAVIWILSVGAGEHAQ